MTACNIVISKLLVRGNERKTDGQLYLDSNNTAPWLEDRDWEMREGYPAQRRRRIETAQMPLRKDPCEPFFYFVLIVHQ